MKPATPSFLTVFALLLPASLATAVTMPQDNWSHYGTKLASPDAFAKRCIAVSGIAVYVGVTSSGFGSDATSIQKYGLDGSYAGPFASNFTDIKGLVCDSDGDLIVFDQGANSLTSFSPNGAMLWTTGGTGSGPGQFAPPSPGYDPVIISVSPDGEIFVPDAGNSRIQVFSEAGVYQRSIGGPGTAGGQFTRPAGVAISNGFIYAVDYPGSSNRERVQQLKMDGTFVESIGTDNSVNFDLGRFGVTPDGLLALLRSSSSIQGSLYDASLTYIGAYESAGNVNYSPMPGGMVFTAKGDLWEIYGSTARLLERRHSSTGNPVARNVVPQPKVSTVVQRPGTTLLDIDFEVIDPDSATVEVAALAFVNGSEQFSDILRLNTLVEGTAANVGAGQATNTTKRLTWNAATDWSTEFGEVQIEILAKDQRNLLGFHWITVPANGSTPAFTASAEPVYDWDLKSVWLWLIAKGDPTITLTGGTIKGVGGAYNGQTLYTGGATTATGRTYLFGRLGVRAVTPAELNAISAGNYGFGYRDTNTVVRP